MTPTLEGSRFEMITRLQTGIIFDLWSIMAWILSTRPEVVGRAIDRDSHQSDGSYLLSWLWSKLLVIRCLEMAKVTQLVFDHTRRLPE